MFRACILSSLCSASFAAAPKGGAWSELLPIVSQGYRLNGRDVTPIDDDSQLVRLSKSDDQHVSALAQACLIRKAFILGKDRADGAFDAAFRDAVNEARVVVAGSLLDQAIDQIAGEEPEFESQFEQALEAVGQLTDEVARGVSTQANQVTAATNVAVAEQICREIVREAFLAGRRQGEFGGRFTTKFKPYGANSNFQAVELSNKSGQALSNVVVLTNIQCAYTLPAGKQQENAFGDLFLPPELMAAYRARDDASVKYFNTPKAGVFFISEWPSGGRVELALMPIGEFLNTAAGFRAEVLSSEVAAIDTPPLDLVKRQVERRLERQQQRATGRQSRRR